MKFTKLLKILLGALLLLTLMQAETSIKVWQLRLTRRCPRCRLVGADLKDVDLSRANLKDADLRWARFHNVNLNHADLSGADLRSSYLNEVTTLNTEFCGARMADSAKGYCRAPVSSNLY